jgi:L-threonylcarbamoyladenylate synthase
MLYWSDKVTICKLLSVMQEGKAVIGTSDTVLGLLAPLSLEGWQSLNRIKQRQEKPYLILVKSAAEAEKLIGQPISDQIRHIMVSCWPGPVTLLFKAKDDLPGYMKGAQGTIGIRVPDHAGLQGLLMHCNGLFSTSANKAGEPVPATFQELDPILCSQVDALVADTPEMPQQQSLPSTILDCSQDTIRVVREGAYPIKDLLP